MRRIDLYSFSVKFSVVAKLSVVDAGSLRSRWMGAEDFIRTESSADCQRHAGNSDVTIELHPDDRDIIWLELTIVRDKRLAFDLGLRDEHSIEPSR